MSRVAQLDARRARLDAEAPASVQPLAIEAASSWALRSAPPPRDWVIEGLVPAGRVTSFFGNGGLGKTQIAIQLAVHVAMNRPIFGCKVSGGPVLGIFCEDEPEELERRGRASCSGELIELDSLDRLYILSRDGEDNLLCTFEREQIVMTRFYRQLEATIEQIKPRLTILDTAADLFGGDFMSTPQVRQFLKVALGALCVHHGTAILLLAHPSAAAMQSGDGGGFSVAWNNSVRSRLYLRRPNTKDEEAARDRRVIEVRKANYGPGGAALALIYQRGYFVPDPSPIPEGAMLMRAAKTTARLAIAVLEHARRAAAGGKVASFGQLLEPLKAAGQLGEGTEEALRKRLQRVLAELTDEGLLIASKVPRGYRLPAETTGPTSEGA